MGHHVRIAFFLFHGEEGVNSSGVLVALGAFVGLADTDSLDVIRGGVGRNSGSMLVVLGAFVA